MTSPSSWYAAAHNWRMRAAETRALADDMKEAEPKAIMLRIAADYEKLAEWAEKKLSTLVGQETGCEQVAAATHAVIICLSDTASPRPRPTRVLACALVASRHPGGLKTTTLALS